MRGRRFSILCFALTIGVCSAFGRSNASQNELNLQLDVIINGIPSNKIGSFVLLDGRRIAATRNELLDDGLNVGQSRAPEDLIILDDLPNLKYEYDEPTQTIRITVDDSVRRGQTFDISGSRKKLLPQTDWGALLNYDLLGTSSLMNLQQLFRPGVSLTLDARAFSPYGTFEQTGIISSDLNQATKAIRLNSTFEYSDPNTLTSYRAGDLISGGLTWTRPIRIGGFQAQTNFALRPDLITTPLPSLRGTAAVPSTVDVYVNNSKVFSTDIAPGPFSLDNVPVVTGAGNAELVVTDSAGNTTKTVMPFFASGNLLAPGLTGWSVEGGFPRLSFGSTSDTYLRTPVGSATLRRGISDWMTVEGHAEAGAGVLNGGVGAVVRTGTFGVATTSLSGSRYSGSSGMQATASFETRWSGINFVANLRRTFGNYGDLASATARLQDVRSNGVLPALFTNASPPKALDSITVSSPLPFDPKSSFSASFVHSREDRNRHAEILSASYSRSLPFDASLFATVFHDFGSNKNTGIFVGLSVPIVDSASLSTGLSRGTGGMTTNANVTKPLGPEPGSVGWSLRDAEGAAPNRAATVSYRSSFGTVRAGVSESGSSINGALELRGSIATMHGDVFFSDWIDDAFGVVSAGAPGVGVLVENRPIGVTDARGMLLVPRLRSYERNDISIDPSNLPVDAEVGGADQVATPANHGGVLVNFQVHRDMNSALVTFRRADGVFVPAGSVGRIDGGDDFIVGYDGQAFIKNLDGSNLATIDLVEGSCSARFKYSPSPGEQVRIGPLTCAPAHDQQPITMDSIGLKK